MVLGWTGIVEDEYGHQETERPWLDFEGFETPGSNFHKSDHILLVVVWVSSRPSLHCLKMIMFVCGYLFQHCNFCQVL